MGFRCSLCPRLQGIIQTNGNAYNHNCLPKEFQLNWVSKAGLSPRECLFCSNPWVLRKLFSWESVEPGFVYLVLPTRQVVRWFFVRLAVGIPYITH